MNTDLQRRFASACEHNIRSFGERPKALTVISDNDLTTIFEITADEVTGMTWDYEEAAEEIFEAVCRRLTS
ncbi:MAG: hypothetical protein CL460_09420 [Acidimicrobiaceae bacterium]|nr:hypothetical protein [Acidimicrobiaceae bacterium]|tara:strand:- start:1964 stop:2176 length:213 start_codon:yes stop_codon:yes gene_type:complete